MEDIVKSLEQIGGKGSFYGMQSISADKLKLEIEGLGLLKFPLNVRTVKGLINLAKPAKFGWRDKTLLDKSVRNAWEISKKKVKIDHKFWSEALNTVLDSFKSDLGLSESAVLKAELHNLLIYERGQFFSLHQDSEKSEGMVASLVIVLPSEHRGGSLVIEHQGTKKEFKSERSPLDKLSFIAFYADCHHEVKEVKGGYRVTLTYNLILKNNVQKSSPSKASLKTKQEEKITSLLRSYFANTDSIKKTEFYTEPPRKWVYLLDHSYTQKGLSWKHLKNVDRLRAEILKKVAQTLDLEISMALADVQETWDCQMDYDEEYDEDNIQDNELVDSETVLKYWIDEEGKPLRYGDHFVSEKYVCWTKATNEFKPFESEHEGFMGNYGNTMDRWYHRAAIVLWQKKEHYPVLFDIDANSVIHELYKRSKKTAQEAKIRGILESLLPYWSQKFHENKETALVKELFELALYVNDAILAKKMINNFNIDILLPETTPLFISLGKLYGNAWSMDVFNIWTSSKNRWSKDVKIEKIPEIVKIFSTHKNSAELTDWLLAYQFKKIKEEDVYSEKQNNHVEILKNIPERINIIMKLCKACIICQQMNIHLAAIHHIIQHVGVYPPLEIFDAVQNTMKKIISDVIKSGGYEKLQKHIVDHLMAERDKGLRKAEDWSITENIACTCKDCRDLKDFLHSRDSITTTWPLAKDRRAHIHQKIDGLGIPVTHQTKHIGSPHKLVLTKTDDLHYRAKQRFKKIEKALLNITTVP